MSADAARRRKDRSFAIHYSWRDNDGCETRTLDAAVKTIDQPALTEIHEAPREG